MMLISYQEYWDLIKADMESEKESEEVEVPFRNPHVDVA